MPDDPALKTDGLLILRGLYMITSGSFKVFTTLGFLKVVVVLLKISELREGVESLSELVTPFPILLWYFSSGSFFAFTTFYSSIGASLLINIYFIAVCFFGVWAIGSIINFEVGCYRDCLSVLEWLKCCESLVKFLDECFFGVALGIKLLSTNLSLIVVDRSSFLIVVGALMRDTLVYLIKSFIV